MKKAQRVAKLSEELPDTLRKQAHVTVLKAPKKKSNKRFKPDEDVKIWKYFNHESQKSITQLARELNCAPRAIRERYKFYLACEKKTLSLDELQILEKTVARIGKKWTAISKMFPGTSPLIIRDSYNRIGKPKFKAQYPAFHSYQVENDSDGLSSTISDNECSSPEILQFDFFDFDPEFEDNFFLNTYQEYEFE